MNAGLHRLALTTAVLVFVSVGGCSSYGSSMSIKYLYEPVVSFAELKTYRWAEGNASSGTDPLLEANVRFLADRALATKGLSAKADKPDFVISTRYETGYGFELRSLTLAVSRADRSQPVWRGMASGSISTDASSPDLKNAVEGILASFPPK
jgi:hypothetical protein